MPEEAIHVRGLQELQRAFRLADREEAKLLRQELSAAAIPVQRLAEGRAVASIRRISVAGTKVPWAQMRIGQKRSVVYIAPKQRGRNTKRHKSRWARSNLKTLLLDRAMIPALNQRKDEVEKQLERMLGSVGNKWERA